VFNKIDSEKKSHKVQYLFLENEVNEMIDVSAWENLHIKTLIDAIFSYLPEGEPLVDTKDMVTPILNLNAETFIAELIREKIYLFTSQEVPYQTSVAINEIQNRKNGTLYVKATINVAKERYKKMLIGEGGRKIKQIGTVTRKELSAATNRKVYVELKVESM
jgi:GTP-binding protein Era